MDNEVWKNKNLKIRLMMEPSAKRQFSDVLSITKLWEIWSIYMIKKSTLRYKPQKKEVGFQHRDFSFIKICNNMSSPKYSTV